MILVAYLTTGFEIELAILMTITGIGGVGTPYTMGAAIIVLSSLLIFFCIYMTGFMRHILISAEQGISPILPEGEKTFHEAFKFIFKPWPPLIIAAVVAAFSIISSTDYIIASFSIYMVNVATATYLAIAYPLWIIVACAFAWAYFGSIYGLYKLGHKPLRLRPSTEDRMLGVRPFGDLSLSLSTAYFSTMVIMILMGIAATIGSPLIGFVPYMTALMIFLIVGVVLFISPLYAIHKKMVEQKEIERNELHRQAYKGVEVIKEARTNDTVAEMRKKLDSLTSLMTFEMVEKNLNSVPDWPIDTQIMNRFATIVITVIAIVIGNLILRLIA
ncbi:MAG: hypothetical protein JET69_00140 [Methanomassiliicoccales archaeon]|nr:hypothetical protein [Methanomassiliicoccales archaeon]